MFCVRDLQSVDESVWRKLWDGYLDFYDVRLPKETSDNTWRRLLDPETTTFARVAAIDDVPVGFAIAVLHEGSWASAPVCYLEDLFVDPDRRGGGVGRALIQDLIDRAGCEGWSGLYWHTRRDNPARRLYDKFVAADDFVRYRLRF